MSAIGQMDEVLELDLEREYPDHLPIASPAAAAGLVLPLDARWTWRPIAVRFLLATDANVANRLTSVDVCDAEGTAWLRAFAGAVQAAGVAAQEYDFGVDAVPGQVAAGFPIVGRLPKIRVPGGWQLQINVANIQAADQISGIRVYVVKRETGPS